MLVITGLDVGGAEIQIVLLSRELIALGLDVAVVSLTPPVKFADDLTRDGATVFDLGMRKRRADIGSVRLFARLVREWRPDIIHTHMFHANMLGRLLKLAHSRVPLISTSHSQDDFGGSKIRAWLYRVSRSLPDFTTSVSRRATDMYIRSGAFHPNRSGHIPNGLSGEDFMRPSGSARKSTESWARGESFVWLAVGRLVGAKDYPCLFQAIAMLREQGCRSIHLVVAGDGKDRPQLEEELRRLDLTAVVTLLGNRSDVRELMLSADGFVMSSILEGMPMALLEAMATPLPVVCTDVGDNEEIAKLSAVSIVVPTRSPALLAQAMNEIMSASAEAVSLETHRAKEQILQTYSIRAVANKWLQLYGKAIGMRRPS